MPAYVSSVKLRPMPNLENLKSKRSCMCADIAAAIIRSRRESERCCQAFDIERPGVLAHSFKLSDAQELVARKAGFDSWEALRRGVRL